MRAAITIKNFKFSQTADAFFKAFISLIPEIPKTLQVDGKTRSTEPILVEHIYNFLSTLLIVPVRFQTGYLCYLNISIQS